MRIAFVFTGGTIGCVVRGGFMGPEKGQPRALLEAYRARYGITFDYDTVSPYTALSENNTGDTVSRLCACVQQLLRAGYEGIVIAHGTDTLQYSAAALSYALADTPVPILLVSAAYPIEDPRSNALENLHGALRFIAEQKTPGVFVSYRNQGDAVRIHRGARLLESEAFCDRVGSICGAEVGFFDETWRFHKNARDAALPDAIQALGAPTLSAVCPEILRVTPYPGMCYPPLLERVRYVLHGSFHSGTVNTACEEARRFFAQAKEKGIPVFLTGVTRGVAYESTQAFAQLGIQPLFDIAPIAAFMKLWMLHAKDPNGRVSAEQLLAPLAGDVLP